VPFVDSVGLDEMVDHTVVIACSASHTELTALGSLICVETFLEVDQPVGSESSDNLAEAIADSDNWVGLDGFAVPGK
jgi:hypothetical protein